MASIYKTLYIIPNLYHYNIPDWCIENIISIIDESSIDVSIHGKIFEFFLECPLHNTNKNNFKIARQWVEDFYTFTNLQVYSDIYIANIEEYLEEIYFINEMSSDKKIELMKTIINIFIEEARLVETQDILGLMQKYKEILSSKELYKTHEDIKADIPYTLVQDNISTDPDIGTCSYINYLYHCYDFMRPCIYKLYPDYDIVILSTLEDVNSILNGNGNKHIYYQEDLNDKVEISQRILNIFKYIQMYSHDIIIYLSTRSHTKNLLTMEERFEKIEKNMYIYEFPEVIEIKVYNEKKNYILIFITVTIEDTLKTRYKALFTNYINDMFYMKTINYKIQYYDMLI